MGNYFPIGDRFLAFVPLAEPRDPNPGEQVEGNGITPNVPVAASQALDRAYVEALQGIHASLTDAVDRAAYAALIEQARVTGAPGLGQD